MTPPRSAGRERSDSAAKLVETGAGAGADGRYAAALDTSIRALAELGRLGP